MTLDEFLAEWRSDSPTVMVHTSGSTGAPKPMLVEKRRMEASARITCDFLGLRQGDTALLCLPLDYIAGKMMVVRALTCGLRLVTTTPCSKPSWEGHVDFAAMVPMQVYNLMQTEQGRQRLMAINHLIIGGGAVDHSMAEALKGFPHAVWSTYGMTETLSHIALRRLSGPEASGWYMPFRGVTLSQAPDGCLVIDAPAVHDGPLVTNDIVEFQPQQPSSGTVQLQPQQLGGAITRSIPFRVLGRKDNIICSGGIKIQMEEVERLLHPHLRVPYIITKCHDEKFGEAVVLLTEGTVAEATAVCQRILPRYWQPRHYLHVVRIPLTATGKPARHEAELLAVKAIHSPLQSERG